MKPVKNVDEYIKNFPKDIQGELVNLRVAIRESAPDAKESISYGMPYYGYKGRLVYFRVSKNHIGIYIPPPIIQDHINELKEYKTAISTVRFPIDRKLPILLIKKLVKARVKFNDFAKK
jgi:uncharacterized protein YdhG (YjbR/CyaY superfamily)